MASTPHLTPAYRAVVALSAPIVNYWARMRVTGVETIPADGPTLLVANHDSYWDTVSVGVAAAHRRQIHALAKAELWHNPIMARVLDGMGQIPIERGRGDAGAIDAAVKLLGDGGCIGIFPEGTRSEGRVLRARSGGGRLAAAVPETQLVCVRITGTTDVVRFPKRPHITIDFFRPSGGNLQPDEQPGELMQRLLDELRAGAPPTMCGRAGKIKALRAKHRL